MCGSLWSRQKCLLWNVEECTHTHTPADLLLLRRGFISSNGRAMEKCDLSSYIHDLNEEAPKSTSGGSKKMNTETTTTTTKTQRAPPHHLQPTFADRRLSLLFPLSLYYLYRPSIHSGLLNGVRLSFGTVHFLVYRTIEERGSQTWECPFFPIGVIDFFFRIE